MTRRRVTLPGSEGDEAERRGGAVGEGAAALAGLLAWWRGRLARGDAADPLNSGFGGVDDSGTARTFGPTSTPVAFPRPVAVPPGGLAVLVHALGAPDSPSSDGEVYSILGMCHFYHDATAGWLSRYATIARAPASPASTEVRTTITNGQPVILIAGVTGSNVNWKVEVYRLERP